MAPIIDWHLRWSSIWQKFNVSRTDNLLPELLTCYRETHRAYHTLQHLAECLHHFDAVRPLARQPVAVELALWFHDVIYDTQRNDNEEASAQWAQSLLLAAGAPETMVQQVMDFIRLTTHGAEPVDRDGALVLDIDLAILGAESVRFAEYETQVRQEYAWVPWPAFCTGRATILRTFLQRPSLYRTPFFQARFEAQARINLAASLQKLR